MIRGLGIMGMEGFLVFWKVNVALRLRLLPSAFCLGPFFPLCLHPALA